MVGPTLLEGKWVYTASSLDFNLATTTPLSVYASGQFDGVTGGSTEVLRVDVAIFLNGERLSVPQSFSGAVHSATDVEIPFIISSTVFVPPGDCKLYLGFFAHGTDVPTVVAPNLAAIGYTR